MLSVTQLTVKIPSGIQKQPQLDPETELSFGIPAG